MGHRLPTMKSAMSAPIEECRSKTNGPPDSFEARATQSLSSRPGTGEAAGEPDSVLPEEHGHTRHRRRRCSKMAGSVNPASTHPADEVGRNEAIAGLVFSPHRGQGPGPTCLHEGQNTSRHFVQTVPIHCSKPPASPPITWVPRCLASSSTLPMGSRGRLHNEHTTLLISAPPF